MLTAQLGLGIVALAPSLPLGFAFLIDEEMAMLI